MAIEQAQDATATFKRPQGVVKDDGVQFDQAESVGTGSGAEDQPFAHFDEKRKKAILRKMDLHLIPVLAVLYLLSFLDRGNIGNAKIEGLQEDLNLTDGQYNWCLTVFFFTYSAFEVPSNLMLKHMRPSIWLPIIMVSWGVVMTLMGLVRNFQGLLAARIFLGVTEAGLFPGVAYYLTNWYRREEMQLRQAMFFSAASVAGAFSGLLAYGIGKMDGLAGLHGWQWIFILEGLVTVVVALGAFWMMYDFPDTAKFLSQEERDFVVWRLKFQHNGHGAQVAQEDGFKWKYARDAFLDWQVWLNIILFWSIVCPLYGISLFLPTIIRQLGYSSSTAQLMTVPIYTTAAVLAVIAAYVSDRVGRRSPFILGFLCIMAAGFAICIGVDPSTNPRVIYAGIFVAACAIYPAFPGCIAWLSNNLAGSTKRSVGMAIQIGVGNLGGAMASNFYRAKDAPWFRLGHTLELGFIVAGIIAVVLLLAGYSWQNRTRARRIDEGALDNYTLQRLSEKGDRAVTFRYVY